jgi:hypothetical protein
MWRVCRGCVEGVSRVCRGCVEGESDGDAGGDGEKAAAVQPLLETIGTELIQESAVTNMAKGSSLALVLLADPRLGKAASELRCQ